MRTTGDSGNEEEKSKIQLEDVAVDTVLKKGFGGKGAEYEERATEVQLVFERWVLKGKVSSSSISFLEPLETKNGFGRTPSWPGKLSPPTCEHTLPTLPTRNIFSTSVISTSVTLQNPSRYEKLRGRSRAIPLARSRVSLYPGARTRNSEPRLRRGYQKVLGRRTGTKNTIEMLSRGCRRPFVLRDDCRRRRAC